METITDQVKYLRRAVEHALDVSKQTAAGPRPAASDGDTDQLQVEELQEQVGNRQTGTATRTSCSGGAAGTGG